MTHTTEDHNHDEPDGGNAPDEAGDAAGAGAEDKKQERAEVRQRSSPSGRVVYQAIAKEAREELDRSSPALFWSALAAGLSMGFSLIGDGVLRHSLPDAPWAHLLAKLGYSLGFLAVILGRQQLFTENTLTPILPLLRRRDLATFTNVMRLWAVVLAANLIGAAAIALVICKTPLFDAQIRGEFLVIARESMQPGFGVMLLRGIFAGWLIALLIWMLPYAESSHFFVILTITWLVGAAHFSHIIAGSVDASVLGWMGEKSWPAIFGGFIVPALLGNILGGVILVAGLNHAQVLAGKKKEG